MTRHVPVKGLKIVTAMLNMYHEANLPRHNLLTPPTKSEMQLIKILLKISDCRGRPACVATSSTKRKMKKVDRSDLTQRYLDTVDTQNT